MSRYSVHELTFSAYLTLCGYISLAWGVAAGLTIFISTFLIDGVSDVLEPLVDTPLPLAMWAVLMLPIIFFASGLLLGLISFVPFRIILRTTDGMFLNLTEVESQESAHLHMREQFPRQRPR
jgi:hypothetical protein